MSSATQGDGFTEVTRGRKKCKASNSPTLPSQPKPSSSEPLLGTPVRPKSSLIKQDSSDTQWCQRKVQKLEIINGRIEVVPP